MPQLKFSIRALLLATVPFALLMAVWSRPPAETVDVKLDRGGKLTVDSDVIALDELQSALSWRHRWMSIWHRNPRAYLAFSGAHLHGSENLLQVLSARIKAAGFPEPTLRILDAEEFFPGYSQLDQRGYDALDMLPAPETAACIVGDRVDILGRGEDGAETLILNAVVTEQTSTNFQLQLPYGGRDLLDQAKHKGLGLIFRRSAAADPLNPAEPTLASEL